MNLSEKVEFSITAAAGGTQTVNFVDGTFVLSGAFLYSTDKSVNSTFPFGASGVLFIGTDDGTNHYGSGMADGGFGVQEHVWSDNSSIVACRTAFNFELKLAAHISAIRAGSFDITVDTNNGVTGMKWTCHAFSTRMQAKAMAYVPNGAFPYTFTPGFTPIAAIGQWHSGAASGTFVGTGIGGAPSIGFGVSCGSQQISISQDEFFKYQNQGTFLTRLVSGAISRQLTISGWDATSVTLSGTSTGEYFSILFLGGGQFSANVGVFNQNDTQIPLLVNDPTAGIFASFNHIHSTAVESGYDLALGSTDGINQKSVWAGGTASHFFDSTYDNDYNTKLVTLKHCTADFTSVIDAQAQFSSFGSEVVNIIWPISDNVARECAYIIFATDISDPPFCGSVGCCTNNKTRMEIELNGVRQAAAHFPNSEFSFSFLLEALKNDVINIKAFQINGAPINMIPSIEIHRTAYVIHDKATGRNLEEPD